MNKRNHTITFAMIWLLRWLLVKVSNAGYGITQCVGILLPQCVGPIH